MSWRHRRPAEEFTITAIRRSLVLALIGTCGCGVPETLWINEPPRPANAISVVWFLEWEDGAFTEAMPVPRTGAASQFLGRGWSGDAPRPLSVTAAYYNLALVQLGLPEGSLQPAEEPRPCEANTPIQVFTTEIGSEGPFVWASTALSADKQAFLTGGEACAAPSRCRDFRVDVRALPGMLGATSIVSLSDNRLIIAQEDGFFTSVDSSDVTRLSALDGQPAISMALQPNGELLLGGRTAAVASGPLSGPFTTATASPRGGIILSLAADPNGSGVVFALESTPRNVQPAELSVLRFDGANWAPVGEPLVIDQFAVAQSRLLWLGPESLIGAYGGGSLIRVEDGEVRLIDATARSPFGTARANVITRFIDADGRDSLYVGGSDSVLYRAATADLEAWEIVGSARFFAGILGIAPADGGLLLGGEAGVVQAFYPEEGFCPSQAIVASDAELISTVGDTIVVTGGAITADNTPSVTLIR